MSYPEHERDMKVLTAALELFEMGHEASADNLEDRTELTQHEVQNALRALATEGIIDAGPESVGGYYGVIRTLPGAREQAGIWPVAAEAQYERLLAILETLAENGTPEQKSKADKLLEILKESGRSVAIDLIARLPFVLSGMS